LGDAGGADVLVRGDGEGVEGIGVVDEGLLALQLVERIYEAVVDADAWHDFVAELSEALGGPAVQISLRLPDAEPTPDAYYKTGLDDSYHAAFVKHALQGLPWGSLAHDSFRARFGLAAEVLAEDTVEEAGFYRDFMQPQGLAPEWPICHVIRTHKGAPIAGIVIYRREGGPPIGPESLTLLDSLVPHLARAYAIHAQLANARHERTALAEVIDRLPVGVILLDSEGRAVLTNRSVEKILQLNDGFRLERDRPRAWDARDNRSLKLAISEATRHEDNRGQAHGGFVCLSRPTGRRAYPVWVGSLLAAAPDHRTDEAKTILFIADPEGGLISTCEVLQELYQLTRAEAELVRMIAGGQSLDQVAEARGVTMNTVRSQLKQVFCKTDTKRQGELVHVVLTGIASIRTDAGGPPTHSASSAESAS
jgi:DNA-binding CsgD family transcriptional regulator